MIPRISSTLKLLLLFGGCLLIWLPQVSYCTTGDELLAESESRRPTYSRRTPTPAYEEERPNPAEENEYYENDGHNNPPLSRQHLSAASPYHEYAPQSDGHRNNDNVGFMRHQDIAPPKGFPSFDEIQAHFQQTEASSSRNQLRNGGGGGGPGPGRRPPPPQFEYNDAEGPRFGPPPPQFLGRPPPQSPQGRRPYFQRRPPTNDNYNEGPNPYYNEQEHTEPDFPHRHPPFGDKFANFGGPPKNNPRKNRPRHTPPHGGGKNAPFAPSHHPHQQSGFHPNQFHNQGQKVDHHPRPHPPNQFHDEFQGQKVNHHPHPHPPNQFNDEFHDHPGQKVNHHPRPHPPNHFPDEYHGHPGQKVNHPPPHPNQFHDEEFFHPGQKVNHHPHPHPHPNQFHPQGQKVTHPHHLSTPNHPIVLKMSKLTPHHHHPHHHQSDHPIPYEVAGGHNIPPTSYTPISKGQGPPVFYAPSPDVELAQKKKQLEQQKQQEHSQPEFNPVHVEIDDHEDEDSLPHPNFKRENSNLVQPSSSKRKTVTTLRQKHVKKDEGSKKPPPLPPTKNRPEMTNDNDTSKPRTRGRQRRQSDAPDDTTKAKQNVINLNNSPEGRGYPNDDDDLADNSNIPEVQPYPVEDDDNSNQQHHRTRRSTRNDDDDDMLADGLDNIESLWQPAPPPPQQQQQASSSPSSSASYIRFDRYKKHGEESVEQRSPNSPTSSNVSFHDSNSEEQRFFPSFPSPYLTGLSPFGLSNALSASPITGGIGGSGIGRAPLFPGPSSNNNRAPSRYHPSSNAPFKFGGISSPLSNRGPSSAASHGHDRYREHDNNLLGSGNFEVIRGGTYYGEDDEGPSYHHHGHHQAASPYRDEDDGYYSQNNGHSSPYHMGGGGGDFFANFRDFADINPHSRSYSHQTETRVEHVGRTPSADRRTSVRDELLQTASSQHNNNKPQFSLEYDPMMATF